MIYLDLRLDDVGKDQWMYTLYYMDHIYRFTLPEPLEEMSVAMRQKTIGAMIGPIWMEERESKLEERPREGVENYLGIDIEWVEDGDDEEEDQEE